MDTLLERFPAEDTTIILDPPRKGCRKEGLEMLLKAKNHGRNQFVTPNFSLVNAITRPRLNTNTSPAVELPDQFVPNRCHLV